MNESGEMRVRCVLCRKHYEKLGKWKEMLADAQVSCQSVVFHCSLHPFICSFLPTILTFLTPAGDLSE